jgi:hypothetical protein
MVHERRISSAGDHAPGLIDALRPFVKQLLRLRREVRGRLRPQRRAHVLAGRDEEGLPVGGFVLQQHLQQLVVLDMGKTRPAEQLTLAVELIGRAELFGVAPTSQKPSTY